MADEVKMERIVAEEFVGGNRDAHLWKATLTSGRILVRGDRLDGEVVLTPSKIPADKLKRVELIPALERSKWPAMSVELEEGDSLWFRRTRDRKINVTTGEILYDGLVAVALGRVSKDGVREVQWAFPDGRTVIHPGTLEDLINAGLAPK